MWASAAGRSSLSRPISLSQSKNSYRQNSFRYGSTCYESSYHRSSLSKSHNHAGSIGHCRSNMSARHIRNGRSRWPIQCSQKSRVDTRHSVPSPKSKTCGRSFLTTLSGFTMASGCGSGPSKSQRSLRSFVRRSAGSGGNGSLPRPRWRSYSLSAKGRRRSRRARRSMSGSNYSNNLSSNGYSLSRDYIMSNAGHCPTCASREKTAWSRSSRSMSRTSHVRRSSKGHSETLQSHFEYYLGGNKSLCVECLLSKL